MEFAVNSRIGTPSVVVLAKQRYGLRERDLTALDAQFVHFSAHTRMSGVDVHGRRIRKGSVDAMNDILAGRVDAYLGSYASFAGYLKAGKVRVIAAVSKRRNAMVPDVPTMPELGYPDIYFESWFGLVTPAGTPRPVVQRLHQEFTRAVASPDIEAKLVARL